MICRICSKISAQVGFERDNPILACGHAQHLPTPEELAREATEEAERQIALLMRQRGVDRDTAMTIFVEETTAELTEDVAKDQEKLKERLSKIPDNVWKKRTNSRRVRFGKFSTKPRWVGPLVDPTVKYITDE